MGERTSNKKTKPKRSPQQIIEKLKDQGITFEHVSEEEALAMLSREMNYFRVAAFRKNYIKGENGKYIGLDFGALLELYRLDRALRHELLIMCLDLEQALKAKILVDIDADGTTDGYDIVKQFLMKDKSALHQIETNATTVFSKGMLEKYFTMDKGDDQCRPILAYDDCPAWVLTEALNFYDFSKFYKSYYESRDRDYIAGAVISLIRDLRNGCAHNNELLVDLNSGRTFIQRDLLEYIGRFTTDRRFDQRIYTGRPTLEIIALFHAYEKACGLLQTREAATGLMQVFRDAKLHAEYYDGSLILKESWLLIKRLLGMYTLSSGG